MGEGDKFQDPKIWTPQDVVLEECFFLYFIYHDSETREFTCCHEAHGVITMDHTENRVFLVHLHLAGQRNSVGLRIEMWSNISYDEHYRVLKIIQILSSFTDLAR